MLHGKLPLDDKLIQFSLYMLMLMPVKHTLLALFAALRWWHFLILFFLLQLVRNNSMLEKKLKGLYSLVSRKAAIEVKRNNTKARLQQSVNVKDNKDCVSIIDQMASLKQLMTILNWL